MTSPPIHPPSAPAAGVAPASGRDTLTTVGGGVANGISTGVTPAPATLTALPAPDALAG